MRVKAGWLVLDDWPSTVWICAWMLKAKRCDCNSSRGKNCRGSSDLELRDAGSALAAVHFASYWWGRPKARLNWKPLSPVTLFVKVHVETALVLFPFCRCCFHVIYGWRGSGQQPHRAAVARASVCFIIVFSLRCSRSVPSSVNTLKRVTPLNKWPLKWFLLCRRQCVRHPSPRRYCTQAAVSIYRYTQQQSREQLKPTLGLLECTLHTVEDVSRSKGLFVRAPH